MTLNSLKNHYVNNMFDAQLKEESEKKQFPKDLKRAYNLGQKLSK